MNYFINKYKKGTELEKQSINLPSSKSESNRLLILSALCDDDFDIKNLSEARDTKTLKKLLSTLGQDQSLDVLDAGTAMRFLTAYLAVTTDKTITLTGSERMQQRPIGTLVNALRTLGANISYKRNDGFPPLEIAPFAEQKSTNISVPGHISSQYISALLMIAPKLSKGLTIEIVPPIYSLPYIKMTRSLMEKAGIKVHGPDNTLHIDSQKYQQIHYTVESDWSAASYWYSFIALSDLNTEIHLKGLRKKSYQGDQAIVHLMKNLGVATTFTDEGALVKKVESTYAKELEIDFREYPDLAQTVITCCAALKINLKLTGLESLKIKETDRILALQNELEKFNCKLIQKNDSAWALESDQFTAKGTIEVNTYDDHRMAMSFAPLALTTHLIIENTEVVNKSYPHFWKDLERVGMKLNEK